MTVRYPVALTPEAALNLPVGWAAREKEAEGLAGEAVVFVRELCGPAFSTRDAALAAYAGRIDESSAGPVQPQDRYCELMEVLAPDSGRAARGQAQPTFAHGRRWPEPKRIAATVWRLSIGYWRPISQQTPEPLAQARQLRRSQSAQSADAQTLRRIALQPLKPVKPQQPLDIGLFETPLPENPSLLIPDE